MRKNILIIILFLLCLVFASCDKEREKGTKMIIQNESVLNINNEKIHITINKENGSISSLINNETSRDYIEGSNGGNFSLCCDFSTSDYYLSSTNSTSAKIFSSRDYKPLITVFEDDNKASINMKYDILDDKTNIQVDCNINFIKNQNEFEIGYYVKNNNEKDSVIVSFTGFIVSGIRDSEKTLDLFYADKEGKIHENAVSKGFSTLKLNKQYPSNYSMQLMQLFNQDEALYYYVKDTSREYKEFNFGAFISKNDFDKEVKLQDKVSMSCTQYPFIKNGEEKEIFKTVIGMSTDLSWYEGSDSYRKFLIDNKMDRKHNDFVNEWTGFVSDTIQSFGDIPLKKYVGGLTSDKVVEMRDDINIDTVVLFGWHKGGFDSHYPDYEIIDGDGYGIDNFKKMIESAHQNNDKVIAYLNAHITAMNSNWGNEVINKETNLTNMLSSALKKSGFNENVNVNNYTNYMYYESYGTTTGYYATCPCSDIFVEQIAKVVEKLADCGIDGLWMDQMMEMPSYMCFDKSHNHKTPATAYAEGYKKLYSRIDKIFNDRGIEHLIFAEGTTDAWIEYIDVCAYMWGRKLYSIDKDGVKMQPHITSYTMPCKFLGINGDDTIYDHAYGYLFASPLLDAKSELDKKVTTLYINNKDIYFYGRYFEKRGLNISNDKVIGSLILGEERIGVSLYNNSKEEITTIVSIDLDKLGINREIKEVIDLINNEKITFSGNSIMIKIKPNDIASIAYSFDSNLNN